MKFLINNRVCIDTYKHVFECHLTSNNRVCIHTYKHVFECHLTSNIRIAIIHSEFIETPHEFKVIL